MANPVKCHQTCRNFKPYGWCVKHDCNIRKCDYSACKDHDPKEVKGAA